MMLGSQNHLWSCYLCNWFWWFRDGILVTVVAGFPREAILSKTTFISPFTSFHTWDINNYKWNAYLSFAFFPSRIYIFLNSCNDNLRVSKIRFIKYFSHQNTETHWWDICKINPKWNWKLNMVFSFLSLLWPQHLIFSGRQKTLRRNWIITMPLANATIITTTPVSN